MFLFSLVCIVAAYFEGVFTETVNEGSFLHVTDFHWDFSYNGTDWSCNGDVEMHGIYGDYWCDSPWKLIQSSVEAMKNAAPNPDFIFWTGDSVLHTSDSHLSLEKNNELLENISQLLKDHFPDTPTYATYGNHDYFPNGQFPPGNNKLYNKSYEYWEEWINKDHDPQQEANFRKGAYYTIKDKNGMRILALNTNLYYTSDKVTATIQDPADQFQWMTRVLNESRNNDEKVLITGHVPPGIDATEGTRWFYQHFNKRFNEIILEYDDVISGMHFGHEHTDNTRIYKKNGKPVVVLFLAPSITPWRYKIPQGIGPPHNPGFRLVRYDRNTGKHLEMVQYYMDLMKSNALNRADWIVQYSSKENMSISDITPNSVDKFLSKMKKPDAIEFKNHFKWRTGNVNHPDAQKCDINCHAKVYCNVYNLEFDGFNNCVADVLSLTSGADRVLQQSVFLRVMLVAGIIVLITQML